MQLELKRIEFINMFFRSANLIEVFLNVYPFCLAHQVSAHNLFQDEDSGLAYEFKAKKLLEIARAGGSVAQFRGAIETGEDKEVIIGAFALLTALARHIADTLDDQLY